MPKVRGSGQEQWRGDLVQLESLLGFGVGACCVASGGRSAHLPRSGSPQHQYMTLVHSLHLYCVLVTCGGIWPLSDVFTTSGIDDYIIVNFMA